MPAIEIDEEGTLVPVKVMISSARIRLTRGATARRCKLNSILGFSQTLKTGSWREFSVELDRKFAILIFGKQNDLDGYIGKNEI